MGRKRLTYEYIKNYIESIDGYTLLSKEYIGAHFKLRVRCSVGHEYEVTYGKLKAGQRCAACNGNKKHTYEYIKRQFTNKEYTLLSKEYKNNNTKMDVKCPKGHEYKSAYANFQQGQRCPTCRIENWRLEYDHVKNQIEKEGYKLISDVYIDSKTKLKIQCSIGHDYEITYNQFQAGNRCPTYWYTNISSKAEREIQTYIKTLVDDVKENDRTQILNPLTNHYLELDVWLPEQMKAIEYNGTYWHSSDYAKYKDRIKKEQCKQIGIDLLVVEEQDYTDDKYKELQKIKDFIIKD